MGVPAVIWKGSGSAYCIPDALEVRNLRATATTNQMVFGPASGFRSTINVAAPGGDRTYTIPDVLGNAAFVMDFGSQTIDGFKTFVRNVSIQASTLIFRSASTTVSLTTAAPSAPRLFTLPDQPSGDILVTTGNQTVTGTYAYSNAIAITATTNQLTLGTTNTTTINSVAPAASRVYTIPDAGAAAEFVMTQGTLQTLAGTYLFSNGVGLRATTNQLTLGTTNTVIINSPAPAASRVYTLPDAGAAANFILSQAIAAQAIASTTTFTLNAGTTFALNVATATTPVAALAFTAAGAGTIGPATSNQVLTVNQSRTDFFNLSGTLTRVGYITSSKASATFQFVADTGNILEMGANNAITASCSTAGAWTFPIATTHTFGSSAGAASTALIVDAASTHLREIIIRQAGGTRLGLRVVQTSNDCYLLTNGVALNFSTDSATSIHGFFSTTGKFRLNHHIEIPRADAGGSGNIDYTLGTVGGLHFNSGSEKTLQAVNGDGTDGRMLYITNTSGTLIIKDTSAAVGTANGRIITGSGADLTITGDGGVTMVYNAGDNRWRVLSVVN